MARDLQKFVTVFAGCISQGAAHIYVSALPFSPRSSAVWAQYMQDYPRTLRIRAGGLSGWPAMQNILSGHGSCISSVAFSPDGHCIVSSSFDATIRVWDGETGEEVVEPMEGHSSWVESVAFSPDGRHIVSGSSDRTIRVWDFKAGEEAVGPLKSHSGEVLSVALPPDGHRAISRPEDMANRARGSSGSKVRMLSAFNGTLVNSPSSSRRVMKPRPVSLTVQS